MTQPIGIGLVGAGAFGEFCLAAFSEMLDVRIAAVADLDVARAGALAAQYGAATSALQLSDNLGVALGAGAAGAIITFAHNLEWAPGTGVAAALVPSIVVAVTGLLVTRRLPSLADAAPLPDERSVARA